jgi:RNA polymerase subunit RPABC4/transcription elongation factor Spt4
MTDLLNFKPDRKLEFEPGRPLGFDPRRPLEFDPRRDLEFNVNRDLGFGHRGVVFRGFVCPICGALVTEDAKRCDECGTVFEGKPRAATPPAGTPATVPKSAKPVSSPKTPSPRTPSAPAGTVSCPRCGVRLKRADAFCWNCGSRSGSTETVKLPAQQSPPPVTREWRGQR